MGRLFFTILMVVVYTATMGLSYLYFRGKFAFESSYIADIGLVQGDAVEGVREEERSRLYESRRDSPVTRSGTVFRKDALLVVAEDIIRKQMEPYKVRLLDLYMDRAGVIYVDLGGELKNNFRGSAAEELDVITGLYKGIEFKVPGFSALKILVDGKEIESFGGHIDVSRPIGEEIAKGT